MCVCVCVWFETTFSVAFVRPAERRKKNKWTDVRRQLRNGRKSNKENGGRSVLPSGGLPWRRDCCYGDRYQTTPSASIGGNSPDSFLLSSSHFLTAIQLLPPTDWIKIMTRFSSFGFLLVKCEEWRENGEWGCCGGVSWLFTPTAIYTEKTSQNGFSKNAFFSLLFSLSLLFLPLWNFQWLEFYESQECRVGKISTARVEGIIIINNNNNNNNNKNDDEYLA